MQGRGAPHSFDSPNPCDPKLCHSPTLLPSQLQRAAPRHLRTGLPESLRFWVSGLGFRVWGLGGGGLGSRVWGIARILQASVGS